MTVMPRMFVIVLTLATMAAPLAPALCRVECADAALGQTAAVAHHSCHQPKAPSTVSVTAVPHVCGHGDEAPPAALERVQQAMAAPVAIASLALCTPVANTLPRAVGDVQHSPPRPFQLVTELRV